jgi:hypothetical protein
MCVACCDFVWIVIVHDVAAVLAAVCHHVVDGHHYQAAKISIRLFLVRPFLLSTFPSFPLAPNTIPLFSEAIPVAVFLPFVRVDVSLKMDAQEIGSHYEPPPRAGLSTPLVTLVPLQVECVPVERIVVWRLESFLSTLCL